MSKTPEEKREQNRLYQKRRRAGRGDWCRELDRRRNQTDRRRETRRNDYRRHRDEIMAKRRVKYWADPDATRAKKRQQYAANPETVRRQTLKSSYGMTLEEFNAMRDGQGGACAICNEPFSKTPHVDHDHTTGRVRALLCTGCNTGLGRFRDDPIRLQAAAAYIRKHSGPALKLVKDAM